jgi:glycerate kinase
VSASVPLRILVIPDKFKGTLTAREAAAAMADGWRRARPGDSLKVLPMCDGGDGFGEVMAGLLGAKVQSARTLDAAHRPCTMQWWWEPRRGLALIESARVIGLAMLPPNEFHPFELDTFGLGAVLQAAAKKGARQCLVGVGGSATNDGGFGLARALGWRFADRLGRSIERWADLARLAHIRAPQRRRWFKQLIVAVDVRNLLLGQRGATRVYGPQKGLPPGDLPQAEFCLRRLAQALQADSGSVLARVPGAGAAGGLGFGLLAFLGARLEPGFELFARYAGLERHLRWANLVMTGEGAIDKSTLMGKGVGQLAQRCRKLGLPCLGLAGSLGPSAATRGAFEQLHALVELTTLEHAKAKPALWLERLAARVAGQWAQQSQEAPAW